jgi:osmotically-inducible protein OsmY
MPIQIRPEIQLSNKDVEKKRLPQEYYVEKSLAANSQDVVLQEKIWSLLKNFSGLDLAEIEIDISEGQVTVMGTFPNEQTQGHVVHHIMNLGGVKRIDDRSHVLHKHVLKETFDEEL